WLIDLVLHLDRHLVELLVRYELWIYPILFAVIFAETGLVVTPFLPGDSLLFAVGALAAVDRSGTLQAPLASVTLGAAAVLGNTPLVKQNFGLVTLAIIAASLVPLAIALRRRAAPGA